MPIHTLVRHPAHLTLWIAPGEWHDPGHAVMTRPEWECIANDRASEKAARERFGNSVPTSPGEWSLVEED